VFFLPLLIHLSQVSRSEFVLVCLVIKGENPREHRNSQIKTRRNEAEAKFRRHPLLPSLACVSVAAARRGAT
jgi:hypothetical protein